MLYEIKSHSLNIFLHYNGSPNYFKELIKFVCKIYNEPTFFYDFNILPLK